MLRRSAVKNGVAKSVLEIVTQLTITLCCAYNQAQERPTMSSTHSFTSPGAVLDCYREAFAKGEWRKCYACLTPESQKYVLFDLAFECMESGSEKAAKICSAYGLDNESLKNEFDKRRKSENLNTTNSGNKRLTDELLRREIVASLVRDKAGFYDAACRFLQSVQQNTPVGALREVRVNGDTATGIVQISSTQISSLRGEPSKKVQSTVNQTMKFRIVDGSWLIDML